MTYADNIPTHEELKKLARQWLVDSIRDAEAYYAGQTDVSEADWVERIDTLQVMKEEAQQNAALNRTDKYTRQADSILKDSGITLDKDSSQYKLLKREVAKLTAELMDAHLELVAGADSTVLKEEAGKVSQAMPVTEAVVSVPEKSSAPLMSTVVDKYVTVKQEDGSWSERTAMQQEHAPRLFISIMGDMALDTITRDDVREFRSQVQLLPPNMDKGVCAGKSIQEILKLGLKPVSVQTAKQRLERVSTFFKWAVREEFMDKNPADGITIKDKAKGKKASSRKMFEADDLKLLFGSDDYTQGLFKKEWYYWMPLLGLYTGARAGELAQLHVDDIIQEDGVWLLNITDDDEGTEGGRTVKTAAGIRRVPVHSALLKVGFLEYVELLRQRGEKQLFPTLKKGKAGWSDYPSKRFTDYRRKAGVGDNGKVFHSFRHGAFSVLLNESDLPLEHVQELLGHEQKSVAYASYFHGLKPQRLQEMIELLDWPIDLEAIAGKWKTCGKWMAQG